MTQWSEQAPAKKGFYWCKQHDSVRMVKVWGYSTYSTSLLTNEDGGAAVTDHMYKDALWQGPILHPDQKKQIDITPALTGVIVTSIDKYRTGGVNKDYDKARVVLDLSFPKHKRLYYLFKTIMER